MSRELGHTGALQDTRYAAGEALLLLLKEQKERTTPVRGGTLARKQLDPLPASGAPRFLSWSCCFDLVRAQLAASS